MTGDDEHKKVDEDTGGEVGIAIERHANRRNLENELGPIDDKEILKHRSSDIIQGS